MKLSDVSAVLNFSAFRPEPDDRLAPWNRRFAQQATLLLNISRSHTSWRAVNRSGKIVESGSQDGEFKEIVANLAPDWRALTDDGWCGVSMNTRYVLSLETNVSRKPGVEEIIRTNPRAVLGGRYERGKRYCFTNNPECVSTILLAIDEDQIKQIETQMVSAGLKVGRICCGTYAMMRRLLETVHAGAEKAKKEAVEGRRAACLNIVCCDGSICAMVENGDLWTELRSRSDLYNGADPEPAIEILSPLIARLEEDATMRFVGDHENSAVLEGLRKRFPQAEITDYSRPDHLWKVMLDS